MGTIESNTRTSSDRVQERSGIKGISFTAVKEQKEKWQLGGDKRHGGSIAGQETMAN